MQSLASLAPASSTESRWSGMPSSTGVSQVPQVPSRQEDSTPTPASSIASRMDLSGGTVRVRSLCARWTSNASCSTGSVSGLATNRSTCSEPFGQCAQLLLDRGQQRLGSAAVDLGVGLRPSEQAVEVEQAVFVLRPDRDPVAVGREFVEEGHRGPLPAAVDQLPVGAGGLGGADHRQHRGDADAAGDEQVARRVDEREVVAWPADPDDVAGVQLVVHVQRPAAAVRVTQDAEPPGVRSSGSPHSEYCRVAAPSRIRSTCAPGSHGGSGWPSSSCRVRATTPRRRAPWPRPGPRSRTRGWPG